MKRITTKTAPRLLAGKTIARVSTCDCTNTADRDVCHLGIIEFTDGSRLVLDVKELPADYAITGIYYQKEKATT